MTVHNYDKCLDGFIWQKYNFTIQKYIDHHMKFLS